MTSFASDLRFSCSSEMQVPRPENPDMNKVTIRQKERSSFEFQWLRLDMTVTSMTTTNRVSPSDFSYEVELEISKMDYLL